ncbi:MAG: hypothetical protein RLZZ387_3609 [Chloroflexota bacterium]
MRKILLLLALALAALMPAGLPSASAQARTRCFPETGHCVSGAILDYWERNGGLAVFGFPIGPLVPNEVVEASWVGPTQWFERDRLEDHGPEGVMAGRMGARYLELRWIDWQNLPQVSAATPGCAYFPETRHNLCEPFLGYWQRNGGLARFSFPISEPQRERLGEWEGTVQYFERRRMEHHTELAGTPYEVLLGRLAADARAMQPPQTCDTPLAEPLRAAVDSVPFRQWLGCPATEVFADAPAAVQRTTGGLYLWLDLGREGRHVFVAYRSSVRPGNPVVHQRFDDTWQEGVDPVDYLGAQQPGLYAPRRGFGKVWFLHFRRGPESPGLGVEQERAERAVVQRFGTGATAVRLVGEGTTYVFGAQAEQFAEVRP